MWVKRAQILIVEQWFHHIQPYDPSWGQNMSMTFQAKGQDHGVNELKPFSNKLLVVGTSFYHYTYITKHLEQNIVKGQAHSTNALKSLFLEQVVLSC